MSQTSPEVQPRSVRHLLLEQHPCIPPGTGMLLQEPPVHSGDKRWPQPGVWSCRLGFASSLHEEEIKPAFSSSAAGTSRGGSLGSSLGEKGG